MRRDDRRRPRLSARREDPSPVGRARRQCRRERGAGGATRAAGGQVGAEGRALPGPAPHEGDERSRGRQRHRQRRGLPRHPTLR